MADKRKEILERLKESCQIPIEDLQEQLDIIEKQEKEINKYKAIALNNLKTLGI